jgi:RNA polymerase sigma-70 factor (ECF subfamily)
VTRPPRASNAVSGVPRQSFSPLTPIIFFNEDDLPAKLVYDANNYATLFQQGEEKGFAWFFKNLYPALTYYCFKITGDKETSEEIASNAFIKIWQKHERFADAHSIKAYLYRIIRNDALKYLQKEKQQTVVNREVIYLYGNENEKDCFNNLVTAEISRELLHAINSLPAECSKVFRLMYIEGKSIQETATILDLSPSTVKTQKKRGIEALRKTVYSKITLLFVIISCISIFK